MWLNVAHLCATRAIRGVGGRPCPEARKCQGEETPGVSISIVNALVAACYNRDRDPRSLVSTCQRARADPIRYVLPRRACRDYRGPRTGHSYEETDPGIAGFGTSLLHPMMEPSTERLSFCRLGGRSLGLCVCYYRRYASEACRKKKALKSLSASFVRAFTHPRPSPPRPAAAAPARAPPATARTPAAPPPPSAAESPRAIVRPSHPPNNSPAPPTLDGCPLTSPPSRPGTGRDPRPCGSLSDCGGSTPLWPSPRRART